VGGGRWAVGGGAQRLRHPAVSAGRVAIAHRRSPTAEPETRAGGPLGRPLCFRHL